MGKVVVVPDKLQNVIKPPFPEDDEDEHYYVWQVHYEKKNFTVYTNKLLPQCEIKLAVVEFYAKVKKDIINIAWAVLVLILAAALIVTNI